MVAFELALFSVSCYKVTRTASFGRRKEIIGFFDSLSGHNWVSKSGHSPRLEVLDDHNV